MNPCNCGKKYSSQTSILNWGKPVKFANLYTAVLTFENALMLFGRMNK